MVSPGASQCSLQDQRLCPHSTLKIPRNTPVEILLVVLAALDNGLSQRSRRLNHNRHGGGQFSRNLDRAWGGS